MNWKTFLVLTITFAVGFVAGSVVTMKGIKERMEEEQETRDIEQGGKIGV